MKAYGSDRAKVVSDLAEECYARIMRDTGLYSFLPRGVYPIVVYADHAEFLRKTGLPPWSAGAAGSLLAWPARGVARSTAPSSREYRRATG